MFSNVEGGTHASRLQAGIGVLGILVLVNLSLGTNSFPECPLDDSIFERVEADDGQPSSRR
jgi:hypothetical protein